MLIECNIFLFDKKLADLLSQEADEVEDVPAKFAVYSREICAFRERVVKDEICKKSCIIYLKSGENFVIDINYVTLKQKLDK